MPSASYERDERRVRVANLFPYQASSRLPVSRCARLDFLGTATRNAYSSSAIHTSADAVVVVVMVVVARDRFISVFVNGTGKGARNCKLIVNRHRRINLTLAYSFGIALIDARWWRENRISNDRYS